MQILRTLIQYHAKQAGVVAQQLFWQHLYAGTAYAHPVIGTATSIEKFTPQAIKAFYNQLCVARNAHLIIVGYMSLKQAKAVLKILHPQNMLTVQVGG